MGLELLDFEGQPYLASCYENGYVFFSFSSIFHGRMGVVTFPSRRSAYFFDLRTFQQVFALEKHFPEPMLCFAFNERGTRGALALHCVPLLLRGFIALSSTSPFPRVDLLKHSHVS